MWYHAGALIRTLVVVILVKVVTMIIIMRMFRFDPVSSLTSAVALAQITEYSLMFTGGLVVHPTVGAPVERWRV